MTMSNKHNNLDKVDLFRKHQFIDDDDEEDGIQAAVSSTDREMCRKGLTESLSSDDVELERSIVDRSRHRENKKNERAKRKFSSFLSIVVDLYNCFIFLLDCCILLLSLDILYCIFSMEILSKFIFNLCV